MKRFALTICLMTCIALIAGSAYAANQIRGVDVSALPSAAGVQANFFIDNDVAAAGLVIPLEIRTVSGGAFWAAGPFTNGQVAGSRVNNSPLGVAGSGWPAATQVNRRFPVPDAVAFPSCPGQAGLAWNTSAAAVDFISPDAILHGSVSTGDPAAGEDVDLDPGVDASPSYRLSFTVGAAQGKFVVDSTCIRPASHLAFADANAVTYTPIFRACTITVEIPPDPCPVGGTVTPSPANATVGSPVSAQVSGVTDPAPATAGGISYSASRGSIDASGRWTDTPTCADVPGYDVTLYASDAAHSAQACVALQLHVNVSPAPLALSCSNVSRTWSGSNASQTVVASGGCPPYTFSGGAPGTVDQQGNWSFDQGCENVGQSSVTISVTDAVQSTISCTFQLTVSNLAPTCSAIAPVLFPQGVATNVDLGDAVQADGDALTYTYVGGLPGAWGASIAADIFTASRPAGDAASYTVVYTVTDGCVTITCTFDAIFENPCISIVDENGDSYGGALNGTNKNVYVYAEPGSIPGDAGGFDFLICYDNSGLSFLGAAQVGVPGLGDAPGWEYFTYRTGMFGGNCQHGPCPDGYVKLVSIADMNNGHAVPPANFDINGDVLACLTFFVTTDRNFINSCLHVGFCSYDCGDNTVSSKNGNILWVPRNDGGVTFGPNYTCDGNNKPGIEVLPEISFCPGAICVQEPPDDRGDINLNGIANEIGDAVLFTNYFIYGAGVWTAPWQQVQILATDINDDGTVLTVADLIYLIRIITGDEQPFPPGTGTGSPKLAPYANSVNVMSDMTEGGLTVRTNSNVDLGAAYMVFRYSGLSVGAPALGVTGDGLRIKSQASNGELRVLVYGSWEANGSKIDAGSHSLVTIPVSGEGSIELVSTEVSDFNGALLAVNSVAKAVPVDYALEQNYPNPFNAGTVIPVHLKDASEWSVTVFNVAGQVVRTFNGAADAGVVNVTWDGRSSDGSEVPSGIYFYRANAGSFSATKKMVLLK